MEKYEMRSELVRFDLISCPLRFDEMRSDRIESDGA